MRTSTLVLAALLAGPLAAEEQAAVAEGLSPAAAALSPREELELTRLRLRQLRRRLREERQEALRRSKLGHAVTLGAAIQESWTGRAPSGQTYPSLGWEAALSRHWSLKANYLAGTDPSSGRRGTLNWGAGLQVRAYPLGGGPLSGMFVGVGVAYSELSFGGSSFREDPLTGLLRYERSFYDHGWSWAEGLSAGYQWTIGAGMVLALEGELAYQNVARTGNPSSQGVFTEYFNDITAAMKGGIGWLF